MALVFTKGFQMKLLESLLEADALLDGATIRLLGADIAVNQNTVLADITAPGYSGYAESAPVSWNEPHYPAGSQVPHVTGDSVEFRPTTATPQVPATVYGWALVCNQGTPSLIAVERFATPVEMVNPLSTLVIVPSYPTTGVTVV